MKHLCTSVLLLLVAVPFNTFAAAGLSDAVNTQACWIRAPIAIVKTQTEGGRYPASIVRGRPANSDDDSFWDLAPRSYDGILPFQTLVDDVDQFALSDHYLIARQRSGRFAVVDLDAPLQPAKDYTTLAAVNDDLVHHGQPVLTENEFRSFESVYRDYRPPFSLSSIAPCLVIVVAVPIAIVLGLWGRRRLRRLLGGDREKGRSSRTAQRYHDDN